MASLYPDLQPLPPDWSGRPTGMVPVEAAVWQAFRLANLTEISVMYFNVHVGTVVGIDPAESREHALLRAALYAKRVDVIVRTPAETWLLEVKERIRPSAVGQLLTYVPLVRERLPAWPAPRALLIARDADPDVSKICTALGIECYTPPFSRLMPYAGSCR